ncbi:hypothetical protein [Acrocarpospora corrugata]|uniref:hypothetical protein n=1 Tax=Acrocarpospora corrugata TaxID=35763 RepID=UPI0014788A60|nr:hypothetical protein [Acrocarpospora corrugata]
MGALLVHPRLDRAQFGPQVGEHESEFAEPRAQFLQPRGEGGLQVTPARFDSCLDGGPHGPDLGEHSGQFGTEPFSSFAALLQDVPDPLLKVGLAGARLVGGTHAREKTARITSVSTLPPTDASAATPAAAIAAAPTPLTSNGAKAPAASIAISVGGVHLRASDPVARASREIRARTPARIASGRSRDRSASSTSTYRDIDRDH